MESICSVLVDLEEEGGEEEEEDEEVGSSISTVYQPHRVQIEKGEGRLKFNSLRLHCRFLVFHTACAH